MLYLHKVIHPSIHKHSHVQYNFKTSGVTAFAIQEYGHTMSNPHGLKNSSNMHPLKAKRKPKDQHSQVKELDV